MGLADAVQGARRPSQLITWVDADGVALDLSGATITARITRGGVTTDSDGSFVVTNAAAGVFRWDYSAADVATAGVLEVQFTAAFGSAPSPARTFITPWQVHQSN